MLRTVVFVRTAQICIVFAAAAALSGYTALNAMQNSWPATWRQMLVLLQKVPGFCIEVVWWFWGDFGKVLSTKFHCGRHRAVCRSLSASSSHHALSLPAPLTLFINVRQPVRGARAI